MFLKNANFEEAEDYGLQAMNILFDIEEQKIFEKGKKIINLDIIIFNK